MEKFLAVYFCSLLRLKHNAADAAHAMLRIVRSMRCNATLQVKPTANTAAAAVGREALKIFHFSTNGSEVGY